MLRELQLERDKLTNNISKSIDLKLQLKNGAETKLEKINFKINKLITDKSVKIYDALKNTKKEIFISMVKLFMKLLIRL